MKYRPISCLENPVTARWGPRGEGEDDRRAQAIEEDREVRRAEALGSYGLNESIGDMDDLVEEFANGMRGA